MSVKPIPQPLELLLVEDSPIDIRLTKRALASLTVSRDGVTETELDINVSVATNGVEALKFLREESRPLPHLVLLDIKMPLMNGWEVLSEMKADEKLRRIPVVILTTSNDDQDIFKSRDLHANGYVVKPVPKQDFEDAIEAINRYWIQTHAYPEALSA